MRILHTADWHLGKKFDTLDRSQEFDLFLEWLITAIQLHQVDTLLLAGDVFDTGSPSNQAQKQYFDFIKRLTKTCCQQMVVIGGNHDAVSTLHAPKSLLEICNVQVVGGVPEHQQEQLIPLLDEAGKIVAVIAAVPFLRDKDIRLSVAGENNAERMQRISEGIANHYQSLVPLLEAHIANGIPIIATGHLFAAGGLVSDSEKEIHVGSLGQFNAHLFPKEYQYIALGHLHKPQTVAGLTHIRYSGSPIPLSFSEAGDQKVAVLIDIFNQQPLQITEIPIPVFRPLFRVKGTLEEVIQQLKKVTPPDSAPLPPWVEVQVLTDQYLPHLEEQLQIVIQHIEGIHLLVKQIKPTSLPGIGELGTSYQDIAHLSATDVFLLRCKSMLPNENHELMLQTFSEAMQLMQESNID